MKTASTVLLIASGAAVLAAVWVPGAWWQWAITALVLLLAGAGTGGAAAKSVPYAEGGHVGPRKDDDSVRVQISGPITPEDVDAYKRTYGRKADR
ncbi:MAG: hypothetical protein ACTH6N_13755 [Brachybacterium tyrofermentans]|uniref:hypothetical protein n=1 Tax=Brachybacterium tyrofermentans TaxID=47848 RepID=UPI001865C913|nr:hypothetical protein [Brachybacterium tyrofermentans]